MNFVTFGNDSEVNAANGLWDLVDLAEDEAGIVPGFRDRAHVGSFDAGLRALFVAVNEVAAIERPDIGKIWRDRDGLRRKFGAAGEDALRMNGLDPAR